MTTRMQRQDDEDDARTKMHSKDGEDDHEKEDGHHNSGNEKYHDNEG